MRQSMAAFDDNNGVGPVCPGPPGQVPSVERCGSHLDPTLPFQGCMCQKPVNFYSQRSFPILIQIRAFPYPYPHPISV